MLEKIHNDANIIIKETIKENLPHEAVENALKEYNLQGDIRLIAIGKAAWSMAKAASDLLGEQIIDGIVITKYDHSEGELPNIEIIEAGHPLSDDNTISGTAKAVEMAESLTAEDKLLFLISGGGSALFEKPLEGISLGDIVDITDQLLTVGADIVEINMIRKRLSAVKAGRFAKLCEPAKVYTIVLSDVLGDRLDSIASGPAAPDKTTVSEAMAVVEKYNLKLTDKMLEWLSVDTPKQVDNVETIITGSVRTLCDSAAKSAKKLGYNPYIISSTMDCQASEAGKLIASMALETGKTQYSLKKPCAVILGGETVVKIKGDGLGGRNQELALYGAVTLDGTDNAVLLSLGSDGTDGPTDAAGGIVDGTTVSRLYEKGIDVHEILDNNDSYNALKEVDGLIMTGPTGTNVNDVTVLLCK